MNINTNSMIYRFLAFNEVNGSELRVPTNLCPYMRKFLYSSVWAFAVYFLILFLLLGAIATPILAFLSVGLEATVFTWFLYVSGFTVYTLAFLVLVIAVVDYVKDSAATRAIGNAASTAYKAVSKNIFWQWMRAIHDKICPSLTFVDKKRGVRYE